MKSKPAASFSQLDRPQPKRLLILFDSNRDYNVFGITYNKNLDIYISFNSLTSYKYWYLKQKKNHKPTLKYTKYVKLKISNITNTKLNLSKSE